MLIFYLKFFTHKIRLEDDVLFSFVPAKCVPRKPPININRLSRVKRSCKQNE